MKVFLMDENYHPSESELAKEIWELEDVYQLQLLDYLYEISNVGNICMQLQNMRDCLIEDPTGYKDAIKLVRLMYEYLVEN